ncbi:hypothetical protein L0337_29170 [candidate division KSB1 bacterium]|nr:hypothetical protein [candidate division KSB1 bacterium]
MSNLKTKRMDKFHRVLKTSAATIGPAGRSDILFRMLLSIIAQNNANTSR